MNKQAGNPDETNLLTHYRELVYTTPMQRASALR
jgi:hypothetical protein